MKMKTATDVRKEWGSFIDNVAHKKPQFVKRSRDMIFSTNLEMLEGILEPYTFTFSEFVEEDDSVTLSLNEIDIVVNGETKEDSLNILENDLKEYAQEYYDDFEYYFSSLNRKSHYPYVLKVLLAMEKGQKLELAR